MFGAFPLYHPLYTPRMGGPLPGFGATDDALADRFAPAPEDEGGAALPEPAAADPWLEPRLRDVEAKHGGTIATQLRAVLASSPAYRSLTKTYTNLVAQLGAAAQLGVAAQAGNTGVGWQEWYRAQQARIRRAGAERQVVEDTILVQLLLGQAPSYPTSLGRRTVTGPGGWVYDQFANGAIIVAKDPRPDGPLTGRLLPEKARAAVEAEIGRPGRVPVTTPSPDALLARQRAAIARQTRTPAGPTGPAAVAASVAPLNLPEAQRAGIKAKAKAAREKFQALPPEKKRRALLVAGSVAATASAPVAAGLLVSGAALSSLVSWARRRKANTEAVITKGRELDIRVEPETAKLFTRALTWSPAERTAYLRRQTALVKRLGDTGPGRLARQKQEVVTMIDLQLNQEAARLANPATTEAPAITTAALTGYAGLGDFALAEARGGSLSDSAGAPAKLAPRLEIARAGEYVQGGVRLPREACAFVAGYLRKVYIPVAKKQITAEARAKLETLAGQFDQAAQAQTEELATKMALAIGVRNLAVEWLNRTTAEIGQRLIKFAAGTGNIDGLRAWSKQILAHAAALLGALGQPQAASRVYLAISGDTTQAAAVEQAVLAGTVQGAAASLAPIAQRAPEVAPGQTTNSLIGAAQAVDGVVRTLQDRTNAVLGQAGALAQQLGLPGVAKDLQGDPRKALAAVTELETAAAAKGSQEPASRPLADAAQAVGQQAKAELQRLSGAAQVARDVRTAAGRLGVKLPAAPSVCSALPKGSFAQFICLHPALTALAAVGLVGAAIYWQRDRLAGAAVEAGRRLSSTPGPVGVVARVLTPRERTPQAAAAAASAMGALPLGEAPEIRYLDVFDDDEEEEVDDDPSTSGEDTEDPDSD